MNCIRTLFACVVLVLVFSTPGTTKAVHADAVVSGENPENVLGDGVQAYFGANYSAPFAYSFRALGRAGVDIKTAIDADVSHMARLGLNAYRIHIWDREISDESGHILDNEHLDAFDYLLFRLKEHGFNIILTPVAWWPPGYPEPNPVTDSFSDLFSREEMITSPEAISKLKTYMGELLTHHNPYTGVSYVNDAGIIAIELFNEPKHRNATSAQTTAFINELVSAARHAGFSKPIFYNISEEGPDLEHGAAVCKADIQGVSFQWYPTGLTRGGEITANVLPNVETYVDPFLAVPACGNKMRMVYEFDAADVASSTMYPAMASSFRKAGFRWATMFSYDPLHLAHSNTEYYTHYLNLVYTPRKAISFLIASHVFRSGRRAGDSDRVSLDFAQNLGEYLSENRFFHTTTTKSNPVDTEKLFSIAGTGSSVLVRYPGNGAYFLDKKKSGVWELEVFPDIAQLADPYDRSNLLQEVRVPVWREWDMTVALPDLGASFFVTRTNGTAETSTRAAGGRFRVSPGSYLLSADPPPEDLHQRDYHAPPGRSGVSGVQHQSQPEVVENSDLEIATKVFSDTLPAEVTVHVRRLGHRRYTALPMQHLGGYRYRAVIPVDSPLHAKGVIEYAISVHAGGLKQTWPGGVTGSPADWDYAGRGNWRSKIVDPQAPLTVFDAERDHDAMLYPHTWGYGEYAVDIGEGPAPGREALVVDFQGLGETEHSIALRSQFNTAAYTSRLHGAPFRKLRTHYLSSCEKPYRLELSLTGNDGGAFGTLLESSESWQEVVIDFNELKPVPLALLPRAYPIFQKNFAMPVSISQPLQQEQVNGIQFVVRPEQGRVGDGFQPCAIRIGKIELL